jgi:2-polyprenyl-6-methoxyphenol hydroxylase-like FAD-dependent oxidoreductase
MLVHSDAENLADCEWMFLLSWISESETGLSGDKILEDLKERASVFADPFKKAMQSITPDTRMYNNRLSYWPTQPWDSHNGTVTLAGDAAHPMTFREYPTRFR